MGVAFLSRRPLVFAWSAQLAILSFSSERTAAERPILATQSAIERSRESQAETRAALVASLPPSFAPRG